jgi:hypothetical protein
MSLLVCLCNETFVVNRITVTRVSDIKKLDKQLLAVESELFFDYSYRTFMQIFVSEWKWLLGRTSASNNFAKGFYTDGTDLLPTTLDVIRKEVERCDCLQVRVVLLRD